jgi:hypothetical protein
MNHPKDDVAVLSYPANLDASPHSLSRQGVARAGGERGRSPRSNLFAGSFQHSIDERERSDDHAASTRARGTHLLAIDYTHGQARVEDVERPYNRSVSGHESAIC